MEYTKFTIVIKGSLKELEEKYRNFFNMPKDEKVTKKDIGQWLANLAEADIQDI